MKPKTCPEADGKGKGTTKKIRLALIGADQNLQQSVQNIARTEDWVFEPYSDVCHALQSVPFSQPDVVLLDMPAREPASLDYIQKLNCHKPNLPIALLTPYLQFERIVLLLMAGVTGYLLKPASDQQLKDTVLTLARGGAALCEQAQSAILSCFQGFFSSESKKLLSDREIQILVCLSQGMANKEISERLSISHHTVHVHLARIFRNLDVHNREQASQKFLQLCLANPCHRCVPRSQPVPVSALQHTPRSQIQPEASVSHLAIGTAGPASDCRATL